MSRSVTMTSPRAIAVLGMHRSGTSALTGALRLCGAWIGDGAELMKPHPNNPKGYFERRDTHAVCEVLLHSAGADWWKVSGFAPGAVPHAVLAEQESNFGAIVKSLNEHGIWAIKEPRLSLLFPLLRALMPDPVCLLPFRHPLEVAQSLRARNGFGISEGLALWEAYTVSALRVSKGLPRMLVPYEQLVGSPHETLETLCETLTRFGVPGIAMPDTETIDDFISAGLYRQRVAPEEAEPYLLPSQRDLWAALQSGEALEADLPETLGPVSQQHLHDLESRVFASNLDKKLGKAQTRIEDLEAELKAETKRSADLAKELKQATGALASAIERSENSTLQIDRLRQELASSTAELDAAKNRENRAYQQRNIIEAEYNALQAGVHTNKEHARALAETVADLTSKLKAAVDRKNRAHDQRRATEADYNALQSKLAWLRSSREKLQNDLANETKTRKAILASNSWKVTKPLRRVGRFVKGGKPMDNPPRTTPPPRSLKSPRSAQENGSKESKPIDEKTAFTMSDNALEKMDSSDHAGAQAIIDAIEQSGKFTRMSSALRGVSHLRQGRYDQAKREWSDYWANGKTSEIFRKQRGISIRSSSPSEKFKIAPKCTASSKGSRERYCVYTAVFGNYDNLTTPLYMPPSTDFICFTDDAQLSAPGWTVRHVERSDAHPAIHNRDFKIRPHFHLSEYSASLYIDANIAITGDISRLYSSRLKGQRFVAWRHPERIDVFHELEMVLANFRHPPDEMIEEYRALKKLGIPRNSGLIEACFLWRSHQNSELNALMDQWWEHLNNHGRRDQPGLAYLMHKTNVRPSVFPPSFGTTRYNGIFYKLPHVKTPLGAEKRATPNQLPHPSALRLSAEKLQLVWAYNRNHERVASTYMRGYQLSEITKSQADEAHSVQWIEESNLSSVENAIIFVTKGMLKKVEPEKLSKLRGAGNIICADYVDDPLRQELDSEIDLYIAASIKQLLELKATKKQPTHLITHHVDPRIKWDSKVCHAGARIGYFGELVNAKHVNELEKEIEFIGINTKQPDNDWLTQLPNFNVHYAIRNHRKIDGNKPFLKGFTAAHCHANIIVSKNEGDARYYLGDDYPYLIKGDSLTETRKMVDYLRESYLSREWEAGLDIMNDVRNRSSDKHIYNEILRLVSTL